MYDITIIQKENVYTVQAKAGETILTLLQKQGVFLHTPCGGRGTCGKCKVKVTHLEHTLQEQRLLSQEEIDAQIHLACLVKIYKNLTVFIGEDNIEMEIETEGKLKGSANPTLSGRYVIGVDIGTTTVVCYLIELGKGSITGIESEQNKQSIFGGDVISRLSYAREKGLSAINKAICGQLGDMIRRLLQKHGVGEQKLFRIAIAGNTTMIHFLCGWNIEGLSQAPFQPYSVAAHQFTPKELGMGLPNTTIIDILPGYSAFVGADISAAVLASGMYKQEEVSILLDIGTNGEMVIGNKNGMLCTSVAAGPAFEGGNISCGMAGFPGAVYRAEVMGNKISFDTIGKIKPIGICGSGLIDLISAMLQLGYIDETGRMEEKILTQKKNVKGFFLTEQVYLSQQDVRSVQLAKGAMYAGMNILMREYGIASSEIKRLILAGGFGSKLNPISAAQITLLPKELADKVEVIHNGAGAGANLAACDSRHLKTIEGIIAKTTAVDLSRHPDFTDDYMDAMLFEQTI